MTAQHSPTGWPWKELPEDRMNQTKTASRVQHAESIFKVYGDNSPIEAMDAVAASLGMEHLNNPLVAGVSQQWIGAEYETRHWQIGVSWRTSPAIQPATMEEAQAQGTGG